MATSSNIYSFIGETVDSATEAFITAGSSSMIDLVTPLIVTCMTLYFTIYGYMVIVGAVQAPFKEFLLKSMKMMMIMTIALSSSNYIHYVKDIFDDITVSFSDQLNSAVNSSQSNYSGVSSTSIYQVLDSALSDGLNVGDIAADKARDACELCVGKYISWTINEWIINVGTVVLTILAACTVIASKFMLAMLFATGPIFITCLMFPVSSRFFETWFTQVMNYSFNIIFTLILAGFSVFIFKIKVSNMLTLGEDANPSFMAVELLIICFILRYAMLQIPGMVSTLAGGISLAGATIAAALSPARAVGKAVSDYGDKRTSRLDLRTGEMSSKSRLDHLKSGSSLLNPRYWQKRKDFRRENAARGAGWGAARGGKVKQGD